MWTPRRIFECYTWWYVKLPLGFKRLMRDGQLCTSAVRMEQEHCQNVVGGSEARNFFNKLTSVEFCEYLRDRNAVSEQHIYMHNGMGNPQTG
jgi:hypothetical protein